MGHDLQLLVEDVSPREVHDRPPGAGQCAVAGCLVAVPAGVVHVFLFTVEFENDAHLGPGEVYPVVTALARNRVLRYGEGQPVFHEQASGEAFTGRLTGCIQPPAPGKVLRNRRTP